jgi:hypothetical protein
MIPLFMFTPGCCCTTPANDCSICNTQHSQYQMTLDSGWGVGLGTPPCNCATFDGASDTLTFESNCIWRGAGFDSICNSIDDHYDNSMSIALDGSGGLIISAETLGCSYSYHQVGSLNCDAPWTLTLLPGSCGGDCLDAPGATMTITHL